MRKNSRYEMKDAGMGAFSTFFTQSPSFLAHQEEMKRIKGLSNSENLFEIENAFYLICVFLISSFPSILKIAGFSCR